MAATQACYARCGDCGERKERITASVQRRVAREFGFIGTSERVGVDLMQSVLTLFPGDKELTASAFYLRNNICVPCPLAVGVTVPNVMLSEMVSRSKGHDVVPLSLHALCGAAEVTVLCCGSGT